jgi:hypothetical protein
MLVVLVFLSGLSDHFEGVGVTLALASGETSLVEPLSGSSSSLLLLIVAFGESGVALPLGSVLRCTSALVLWTLGVLLLVRLLVAKLLTVELLLLRVAFVSPSFPLLPPLCFASRSVTTISPKSFCKLARRSS